MIVVLLEKQGKLSLGDSLEHAYDTIPASRYRNLNCDQLKDSIFLIVEINRQDLSVSFIHHPSDTNLFEFLQLIN